MKWIVMFIAVAAFVPAFADEVPGRYSVPVPATLSAFATFTDSTVQWQQNGNQATLTFTLPEDLTLEKGEAITLTQAGRPNGAMVPMSGPKGNGSCLVTTPTVSCLMQIQYDVPTDKEIRDFLTHKYPNDPNLESRIAVAKLFGSEPSGGVLMFSLSRD